MDKTNCLTSSRMRARVTINCGKVNIVIFLGLVLQNIVRSSICVVAVLATSGADPGGGHGGPMPPPPPFGTEPARNAEVCHALSARS